MSSKGTWVVASLAIVSWGAAAAQSADPLPSWNKGATRDRVTAFVQAVTDKNGKDYVPPEARIAVFDNDGTLWSEQPMYVQMAFMLDRVKTLAPEHPEWKDKQPYKAALEQDFKALAAQGEKGVMELMAATHTGMSSDEFNRIATDWISRARHPKYKRPYTETVYQPMLELLDYLRDNGFKTYIVSGGGIDFMRPWTEKVYGIPPEQVVGSMGKLEFRLVDGKPVLMRLPQVDHIDDGPGKPVGIQKFIGRKPIAGVRQFRRRPADAAVRRRRAGSTAGLDRAPYGWRARNGLRPQLIDRPSSTRRSMRQRCATGSSST